MFMGRADAKGDLLHKIGWKPLDEQLLHHECAALTFRPRGLAHSTSGPIVQVRCSIGLDPLCHKHVRCRVPR
jgi:hypothetical protein